MGRVGKTWLIGAAAAAAAMVATAGCDPADGLGASSVSVTTDTLATQALERDKVDVQWLSCSAGTGRTEDTVDCVGRTQDQQKITLKGDVTEQMDGECVRGRLTAVVGRRTVFDVRGLGNCTARSPTRS